MISRPSEIALERALTALALPGLAYTEPQLYHEWCRARRRLPVGRRAPDRHPAFAAALRARIAQDGRPPGLLGPPPTPLPRDGREPDLRCCGLARVLVCQDPAIAGMLCANLFHMETSCAVLSLAEATPLPAWLRKMLARAEAPRVFFLHDASAAGLTLVLTLRERLGVDANVGLTVVGLRPRHAWRLWLHATREIAPDPDVVLPEYLTRRERAWLRAGWRAELAAVSPPVLLRALFRIVRGESGTPRPRWPALPRRHTAGLPDLARSHHPRPCAQVNRE